MFWGDGGTRGTEVLKKGGKIMLKSSWGVFSLILCAVFAVALTASAADDGSEVFVVSSSFNGEANYLSLTDGDKLSAQELLQPVIDSETYQWSTGNGLGDFNNDGDLDYIMAIGFWYGNIYISEKLDAGNQFAEPQLVANWGSVDGYYCMDFAVADYNEDGNADFILSLDFTTNSELYLGDGAFGFEYVTLPATAASNSGGADAADFNNDGHADFVIAPSLGGDFYVNLGHGDGTFTTISFASVDGGSLSGVAAANFIGDGAADIVAVYSDKLYVYQGTIVPGEWDTDENDEWVNVGSGGSFDGVSFTYVETDQVPLPFNESGLDNLDFDGDGDQDLVVAGYGENPAGVAVLLNGGNGTFSHFATYAGGSGDERNAVTAGPWEPVPNAAPVAVIAPEYIESTVGEEIVFDGSNSIDEDGRIVSYEWDFGEPEPSADIGLLSLMSAEEAGPGGMEVNPSDTHTYQESGDYVVTLTVTDNQGSTSSVQAQVVVLAKPEPEPEPELIPAKVRFSPRKLYLDGKRARHHRTLRAKIKFAQGFDTRNVDLSSVKIVADNGAEIVAHASMKRGFLYKLANKYNRPRRSISVKFDRQKVIETLGCSSAKETTLTVRGNTLDGDDFKGTGVIRLKMKKGGHCSAD